MALSVLSMQTSTPTILVATMVSALAFAPRTGFADTTQSSELSAWEISIQSTVAWPPIAAPAEKAINKTETDGQSDDSSGSSPRPAMITERTLQASLTGHLLNISDNAVQFAPALEGGAPLSIALDSILSLRRTSLNRLDSPPGKETAQNDSTDRLITFRAGSSLPGRLLRVTEQGLVLAFGASGELTVPLSEILSITPLHTDGNKLGSLPDPDGRHVARLTTGEIITGNITPVTSDSQQLTISSPILSGEFPLALIETMLFPVDSESPAPTIAPPAIGERVCVISFTGGASLSSSEISLIDGMLELEIWEGSPFRIPLASAETISFLSKGGMRPNGPILVWGQHADKADEFGKLQKALKGSIHGRELIIMDEDKDGRDFSAALRRSSAFIWGEWEEFDQGDFDAVLSGEKGQPLDEQLQTFVHTGGTAIFLGMAGGMAEHFGRLGLGKFQADGSIADGTLLELTGIGTALSPFMEGDIKAPNSTMQYFAAEGGEWSPILCLPGDTTKAAIVGKRIGSGWVFLVGMDFYDTDENATRLLVELMRFRK